MKAHHITSLACVMSLVLGVVAAAAAQDRGLLVNFGSGQRGGEQRQPVQGTSGYAPSTPPAASDPGTLYVPARYAQGSNESQEAFVERMKGVDRHAKEEQAKALQRQAQVVATIKGMQGGRPPTEADRLARAEFARFVAEAKAKADEAKARTRQSGVRQGARPTTPVVRPGGASQNR